MKCVLIAVLALVLSLPALAGEAGRFGLGINYGCVSNFKAWRSAQSESGNMLRVDYTYAFNDFYTTALEVAFFGDENVFKTTAAWTYVQTGAFFNINHIFHTAKLGPLSPYLKFGTGIYGVNLYEKLGDNFYFRATDLSSDVNAGMGAEFKLWKARVNVDLMLPALLHTSYFRGKLAYILSFGWKQYF